MNRIQKFVVLLAGLSAMAGVAGNAYAFSLDSSGTGDPSCFKDTFQKFRFVDGEFIDAKKQRYTFAGSGLYGQPSCAITNTFTTQVEAEWDETTKQASELVLHGFPAFATTRIISSCASNPWTNPVACKLVSYRYAPTKGSGTEGGERAGNSQFPVSAGLPRDVMESISRQVAAPQNFALEPQMPPRIFSPAQDEIVRRSVPLRLQIDRPEDGNARWYAENPLGFELEFQMKASPGAGSLSGDWVTKPVLGVAKQGLTTVSYSDLAKFSTAKDLDTWRVRARIKSAREKAWSQWRVFFVETPMFVVPGAHSGTRPEQLKIPGKGVVTPVEIPGEAAASKLPAAPVSQPVVPQISAPVLRQPGTTPTPTVAPTNEPATENPEALPSQRPLPAPGRTTPLPRPNIQAP